MQRTPPSTVRHALREEVGFGCPVQGCGSPYLSWHHFDPPWHETPHHSLPGMIALCKAHHDAADGGAFTKAQLQAMKTAPYLKRLRRATVKGRFHWRRDQLVLRAGRGVYVNCPTLLAIKGRRIVWLTTDTDGYEVLNLDLFGKGGALLFSMRENDWITLADHEDLDCPPQGRSLTVKAPRHDAYLKLHFRTLSRQAFRELLERDSAASRAESARSLERQIAHAESKGETLWARTLRESLTAPSVDYMTPHVLSWLPAAEETSITVCDLAAKLPWPIPVHITATRFVLPGMVMTGTHMHSCGTAISLGAAKL